jgi:hypothetical protein
MQQRKERDLLGWYVLFYAIATLFRYENYKWAAGTDRPPKYKAAEVVERFW